MNDTVIEQSEEITEIPSFEGEYIELSQAEENEETREKEIYSEGEEALPDFSEDKETIAALFPTATGRESDFTENERYIQLRALGLSVKEAYLAVGGEQRRTDTRSHLKSSVPKSAGTPFTQMTRSEMERARELFEGMEESEIRRLYRKVTR